LTKGEILDDVSKLHEPPSMLAESKRTAALLRDARSVLRRIDALASAAAASVMDDNGQGQEFIAAARDATEHLVSHLARRQQSEQRGMKQAVRRLR
jgi:hypothetical protein